MDEFLLLHRRLCPAASGAGLPEISGKSRELKRISLRLRYGKMYLSLLVISAVIFTIFVGPFLEMHGLSWVTVLFYVLIVFAFIYGRTGAMGEDRKL